MIAAKMEMSVSHRSSPVFTELVRDELNEAHHVGYDASEEGIKTTLFSLVGEIYVDVV